MKLHWVGCAGNNFHGGRGNFDIDAVVLHLIDGSQKSADATFLNDNLTNRRSAHYSIGKTGRVHQYVVEEDTAYHAGRLVNPTWSRLKAGVNPNLYTIGIEHEGRPHDEWTDAMYASSAFLLRDIARRWWKLDEVPRSRIVLHRQIRADKSCPGFRFDLERLLRETRAPNAELVADPPELPLLGVPMVVRITKNVNLRRGRPSTKAPIVRVILKGRFVDTGVMVDEKDWMQRDNVIGVVGYVVGERYQGDPCWYRTVADDYFWAGATDCPRPDGS